MLLVLPLLALMTSCEPAAITEGSIFLEPDTTEESRAALEAWLDEVNPEGWSFYTLDSLVDTYAVIEQGNFMSDSTIYRTRTTNGNGIYLFAIDTLPKDGPGIYIRGRVSTDDYAGNFYKSLVIQQIVNGEQQNLRISLDMGSSGGLYQMGQEIIIRCNGLAIGRYANQPQLCIPTYNDNVYANSAKEKIGWAAGRIPAAQFRNSVRLIGHPDPEALVYDEVTPKQLWAMIPRKPAMTAEDMKRVRHFDGRLVRLKNVHFTGQYFTQDGATADCKYAHPDSSEYANVFAPTTQNIGYPQSRVLWGSDNKADNAICCACSEYAKYANYFLPGADQDTLKPVAKCQYWVGTVSGIVGWYADNAKYIPPTNQLKGTEWSITPRGIPGFGVPDIDMKASSTASGWPKNTKWNMEYDTIRKTSPMKEFDPVYYKNYKYPTSNE